MKRDIWIIVVAVINAGLVLGAGCQGKEKAAVSQKSGEVKAEAMSELVTKKAVEEQKAAEEPKKVWVSGPNIKFEKVVVDFGDINPSSAHATEFKFTNTGNGILKIGEIQSACGCTVFKLQNKDYNPGESGTIEVTYTANTTLGETTRVLTVPTNVESESKVTLTVKAKIVTKVAVEPKDLRLSLVKENGGCPDIVVKSLDGKAFSIKGFQSSGGSITAEFEPNAISEKFVLHPKVDVEKLTKALQGQIEITITHPSTKVVAMKYSAPAEYQADPAVLHLFKPVAGVAVIRDVWILSNYNKDFEIEAVSSKKGYIKERKIEKTGNRYKLTLSITPPPQDSLKTRYFADVVTVKMKDGKQVEIAFNGFYPPQTGAKPAGEPQGQVPGQATEKNEK